nr:uncharacterized protein LOC128696863 isoform X1 [Cherax quadricarinatus]
MATITEEERNGFRFIKALNVCGTYTLYKTFVWGTPGKLPSTKVDVYLESLTSPPSTAFYLKANRNQKRFGKVQMETIRNSKDESEFDTSLLYMIIKLGCEKVATINDDKWIIKSSEMEYFITAIKDMRNDILHGPLETDDTTLQDNTKTLEDLLINCLQTAGVRYNIDKTEVDKEIDYVTDKLKKIMNEIPGNKDLLKHCSDKLKKLMLHDTQEKLREQFKKITYINPLSLICKDLQLEVKEIFVDVNLKQENDDEQVDYHDLLVQKTATQHGSSAKPQIILLEGLAGSGKTTLMKLVAQEWKSGAQKKIKGLDDYELVFWLQCKDSTMVSYHDILNRKMPGVSAKFRNLLPGLIELCEVLIIIDGVDELNDDSQKLVNSVLDEFKKFTNKTIIFTSRPEKLETFKKDIPTEYDVTTVKLEGINDSEVAKFIQLTHQEMVKQTRGNRSTQKLINQVLEAKYIQKYLATPMNLTYLIYIWDQTPDELNLMTITQTELYDYIHQLHQSKLLERLANSPGTTIMNLRELKSRLQIILKELYLISLKILSLETLTVDEEMKNSLKSVCKNQSLSYDEIFSAFLYFEKPYPSYYKEILDYFGALYIVMTIKDQHQPSFTDSFRQCSNPNMSSNLPTTTSSTASTSAPATPTSSPPVGIRGVLQQATKKDNSNLTKYRNVFMHVARMLFNYQYELSEAIKEVVDLLHELGMDDDQWLDLLGNIKTNPNSIKVIAGFLNPRGNICIRDNRVGSYAALLPHIVPSQLHIDIKGDPDGLPRLLDLLGNLNNHRCLELKLRHHFLHANTSSTSDKILQHLENNTLSRYRNDLVEFMGHLSSDGMTMLPPSLTSLHLAIVSDDHAQSLLPIDSKLSQLNILSVYVSAEVSPDKLEPLPNLPKVELGLNDVDDAGLGRACDVAGKLQPQDR